VSRPAAFGQRATWQLGQQLGGKRTFTPKANSSEQQNHSPSVEGSCPSSATIPNDLANQSREAPSRAVLRGAQSQLNSPVFEERE